MYICIIIELFIDKNFNRKFIAINCTDVYSVLLIHRTTKNKVIER